MWRADISSDCTKVTYRPCLDKVCEGQNFPVTAPRSPTDLALMKYVMGRIFQWLHQGHIQTLPWWSMWWAEFSSDCTKVTYRPCLDEVCDGQNFPVTAPRSHTDLALMKYVKSRIFLWLHQGHIQTLPWWSMWRADCTKVARTLRHHLMKYVKSRMFRRRRKGHLHTSPSLDVCER